MLYKLHEKKFCNKWGKPDLKQATDNQVKPGSSPCAPDRLNSGWTGAENLGLANNPSLLVCGGVPEENLGSKINKTKDKNSKAESMGSHFPSSTVYLEEVVKS